MNCTTCNAELREGAKFCSECGTPTALACSNCGNSLSAGDKFCADCGTPVVDASPASATRPAPAPRALPDRPEERRIISVMFIDLVGFTPLTEARDSEEVRGLLTRYFDRARETVDRYGGTIDKFIGDAVMAVWGADTAHEDDAERAVRAAMELVDSVEELGKDEGIPELRARAGVLSGEAAVGGDGNEATGLIIGEIVNTASRLQSAADPGAVLVGKSIVDGASAAIEFESAGSIELKGITDPVETWRPLRVVGGRLGNRRADGLLPPFVGRADEMRLLRDSLNATRREGRARLVSIIGQGGIGKSRLANEFWNYADGLSETTYWHHGRSPAYGEGLAFWALGEMVRQRSGIAETDDEHKTRTKLRTMLAEHIADAGDREWIEPRLEALLGLSEAPTGDRAELFAAWRMLFTRIAEIDAVVMVFEDLHWADEGLLDFIDDLTSAAIDFPILVVTLGRAEVLDRRPGWGSGKSNTVSLHLAPLAPSTMAELVTSVVSDAPPDLVETLVEKSGGVPLYAVELLRMLLSQELIAPDKEGRFSVTGDVADIEIPDSLQSLVGARLDQLETEERALLQDAAVLGQSFTVEGLQALRDEPLDQLIAALQPLVSREVLSVNQDPRSPERGQYRFIQSIIREVAHERISRANRLERHLRVAEYFESESDPELAGITASHYLDALEVAPEDQRDELRPKAIAALLAAADRADALQSHPQVVRLSLRGIELTDDPAERGELYIRAAGSDHAGLGEEAEAYARQALSAFDEVDDQQGRLRAATELAVILDDSGRGNEGWQVLIEAIEEGDTAAHAAAYGELSRAYMMDQQYEESLAWADRSLAIAERLDLVPVYTDVLITKGTALGNVYRTRESVTLMEAGLDLAREHQLSKSKWRALNNLAVIGGSDRWFRPELMQERIEDAGRRGEPRQLYETTIEEAWQELWGFNWDRVDEVLEELDAGAVPFATGITYSDLELTKMQLDGRAAEAEVRFRAIWEEQAGVGDAQQALSNVMDRAGVAFYTGRFEEAFDIAIDAEQILPYRVDLWFATMAALQLNDAERLRRVRDRIDASLFRGRVIDLFRSATLGDIAAIDGRSDVAAQHWTEALRLGDEVWPLGASAFLKAAAATSLGTDHPLGEEQARLAYDAFTEVGAHTLLNIYSDGVLAPDMAQEQIGSA
ncbi:MAG: adenylate/guanylate cyclase domain-containing protein [Acidimicrobiia bacterium]|nr:MAG: adenylate/guanylate cyclase domain-containing protein [Acidimicrobiia bacterium]